MAKKKDFLIEYKWWILGFALIYFISPLDFVPDVLPPLTYIDDAIVILLAGSNAFRK